jgi:hypothetical protein
MECVACGGRRFRSSLSAPRYRRFLYRDCGKQFNERMGGSSIAAGTVRPRVAATFFGSKPGSERAARLANHTPSPNVCLARSATAIATRFANAAWPQDRQQSMMGKLVRQFRDDVAAPDHGRQQSRQVRLRPCDAPSVPAMSGNTRFMLSLT